VRGDKVEVLVDVGDAVRSFEIEATKDGRRVEVATVRGNVHVSEVTRYGKEVRTAQFIASRVVAIVEHPAAEEGAEARPRKARAKPKQQDALDI
jgi:predicted phosphodiesterase